MRSRLAQLALLLGPALLLAAGCSSGGGGPGGGTTAPPATGSIRGRLAAPATPGSGRSVPPTRAAGKVAAAQVPFAGVTVELLDVDGSVPREQWKVLRTASPAADGSFAFEGLPAPLPKPGDTAPPSAHGYALRLNQPEQAQVRYGIDTTNFLLAAGQVVNLILPVTTTVVHGMPYRLSATAGGADPAPPASMALDAATGELLFVTAGGFAIFDPDHGTVDLLHSRTLFAGCEVAPPRTPGVAWLVCRDRVARVDRTLFTDPAASEVLDLDDPATQLAVGDRVRWRLLKGYGISSTTSILGVTEWSPDGSVLFIGLMGEPLVLALDVAQAKIVQAFDGKLLAYNPRSNLLALTDGGFGNLGSTFFFVDATTRATVATVPLAGIVGAAAFPADGGFLLLGQYPRQGGVETPWVEIVDGTGTVTFSVPLSLWLGLATDPLPDPNPLLNAPSFDLGGDLVALVGRAYLKQPGGGWAEVSGGIVPSPEFNLGLGTCLGRALDATHRYQVWHACPGPGGPVAFVSLEQANVPVAVTLGLANPSVLLDGPRGRAFFAADGHLVAIHYADPTAAGRPEVLDLSAQAAPFFPSGAACDASTPCSGDQICAAVAQGAASGTCVPNPRLPYVPLCGGLGAAVCDEGLTCQAGDQNVWGAVDVCTGTPSTDYAAHGPPCGPGNACPVGMACGAGSRCEPRSCLADGDCSTGEVCGLQPFIGRVCVAAGPLPDGAACDRPDECQHGTCAPIEALWQLGMDGPNDPRRGFEGVRTCTRPCAGYADCPAGTHCLLGYNRTSGPAWAHTALSKPWCSPSWMPDAVAGCTAGCGPAEVCDLRGSVPACFNPASGPPMVP